MRDPMQTMEAILAITSRLQRRTIEAALEGLDLNLTQALILRYLNFIASDGPVALNQTEIAERLNLRKPATGVALDVLAARGLVVRRPAEDDRRALLVEISDVGRPVAVAVDDRMEAVDRAITQGLSANELAVFVTVLQQIRANLESLDGNGSGARSSLFTEA